MAKRKLVKKGKKKGTGDQQYYTGVFAREHTSRLHQGKPDLCYDICYKKDGKLVWEKIGWVSEGYSPEVAEELRNNRTKAIRHGDELPKEKKKAPIFKEVAVKYVAWAQENKKSGKDDESRYIHHLRPEFDHKRLDDISAFDIEKFKSKAKKSGRVRRDDDHGRKADKSPGLSPQTVKHCIALIRQIYNKATSWGLYDGLNPVREVKMPPVRNTRERFLSYEEADELLKALKKVSQSTHDIALLSLHCGLRAGEIFNLKGQDIKLGQGIIKVVDPKNNESRAAFITRVARQILTNRMPESPEEYIFKDRRHNGKINQISHVFTNTVNRLGFNQGVTDRRQKLTFHSLRHTFASWLALQGESLLTIKELLGHKTLAMVQRYAHLIPDEKRKATMRLEEAFIQNGNKSEKVHE